MAEKCYLYVLSFYWYQTQLVHEIETQALRAERDINLAKSQIAIKQREIRMLQLTSNEVSTLPSDTNVYEGVGKMYG